MLENLDHFLVRMDPGGFGKPWSLLENLRLPGDSHPTTLWYPSSGLDLVPVARLCRGMPRVHTSAPPVDLYLLNDFSAGIQGQIRKLSRHLRHGPVLASVDQVTSRDVWIDQVVPLGMRLPWDTELGQHGDGVMSARAGGHGDAGDWSRTAYFLAGRCLGSPSSQGTFAILFLGMENREFLQLAVGDLGLRFDYVCGVCDGCWEGGNHECVNRRIDDYAAVMAEGGLWISDHLGKVFSGEVMRACFQEVAHLPGWGAYNPGPDGGSHVYRMVMNPTRWTMLELGSDDPPGPGENRHRRMR